MAAKKNYGRRGQEWHPDFIEYVETMAAHPVYEGMPDTYREDGLVQWEAPSNRTSGKFKDTHHRRKDWWRKKAREVGIDPESNEWISRTAKRIHPTQSKPCKRCGRVLDIRYVYPQEKIFGRLRKLGYDDPAFLLDPFERIGPLVARLHGHYGDRVLAHLPTILRASGTRPPDGATTLADWLRWIEDDYVPGEPSVLSPGAMSNAPDRFDGFHSFNLCCRAKADTGRHRANLATYVTDRRVFEHWNDGDWIAADRMMGLVRTQLVSEECLYGHAGRCSADHIGPLSLGFAHRPEFQLLCTSCNAAKNNRMSLRDVSRLLAAEAAGERVISWHSAALWEMCKGRVVDDETARRLSKVLRDHRHAVMAVLESVREKGHYAFLATLLHLEVADRNVEFVGLRAEDHVTRYDRIVATDRQSTYALEQKARRIRVAFAALHDYAQQTGGHAFTISDPTIDQAVASALRLLATSPEHVKLLDARIANVVADDGDGEAELRRVAESVSALVPVPGFADAKRLLGDALATAATNLADMWDDERYVRSEVVSEPSLPINRATIPLR